MPDEVEDWQEASTVQQVMTIQYNVQRIGLFDTLKKSIKGELEIEDLMVPQ